MTNREKPRAVEATDDDETGAVLHAATAEARKGPESSESGPGKAEASATEAAKPQESVTQAGKPEEAELKLRDLLDSQEKMASKEAALLVGMDSTGGEPWTCKADEPLRMEAKAKKPKSKKKKTTRKRREHVEDPIGSYQLGDMYYEGVTLQEATKLYKKHMLRQDKLTRKQDRVSQHMLARGRSLLDSQEQLANKNEKRYGKKKAKAEAKLKDEEAGKADDASATDEETDDELCVVFEDAQDMGASFQSFWDKHYGYYCAYDETTTIPAMRYTNDGDAYVRAMDNLQVVSVKVASIEEGLHWPLDVFGMVSVRDVVDHKRNIIFHRERDNFQRITEKDPYLTLTGPSRAVVVCIDPSYIEVVLKVKGATESEDKELSRLAWTYRHSCLINGLYPCEHSTLKLKFSQVYNSVEATVHVKVTGGSWPDGFKGVFTAATARTKSAKVKLLAVGDDGLPVDADADGGTIVRLSRRVVSVELDGMLKVFVSASGCAACEGDEEERCEACFVPQKAGFSPGVELKIGSCRMEATVAWSLFVGIY